MHDDFTHCYTTLGVTADTAWRDVRSAYRSLVKTWHPDRFPSDSPQRGLAEEKTKEVTRAYQTLESYYKKQKHGTLPPASRPDLSDFDSAASPHPPTTERRADIPLHASGHASSPPGRSRRFSAKTALLFVGAAGIAYVVLQSEHPDMVAPIDSPSTPVPQPVPVERSRFTVGSTVGEVYSAQGVPEKTENDIWHYGRSRVFFHRGAVVKWEEHASHPLHTVDMKPAFAARSAFGQGSTKDDVRSAQGQPWHESGDIWDYGASKVYFSGERVTGWLESPEYPLNIAR